MPCRRKALQGRAKPSPSQAIAMSGAVPCQAEPGRARPSHAVPCRVFLRARTRACARPFVCVPAWAGMCMRACMRACAHLDSAASRERPLSMTDLYIYGLHRYGTYRYGLDRRGLYSYGLDTHGLYISYLYSYGLCRYGLYSYGPAASMEWALSVIEPRPCLRTYMNHTPRQSLQSRMQCPYPSSLVCSARIHPV